MQVIEFDRCNAIVKMDYCHFYQKCHLHGIKQVVCFNYSIPLFIHTFSKKLFSTDKISRSILMGYLSTIKKREEKNYIMKTEHHYETVSEAINQLREKGFTVDFNIEGDYLICESNKLQTDEFEIVDVYRYEGDTDPADEATVYAIESTSGIKGILVTGYGIYSDTFSSAVLSKLSNR